MIKVENGTRLDTIAQFLEGKEIKALKVKNVRLTEKENQMKACKDPTPSKRSLQVTSWNYLTQSLSRRLKNYRDIYIKTKEELKIYQETYQKLKKVIDKLGRKAPKEWAFHLKKVNNKAIHSK